MELEREAAQVAMNSAIHCEDILNLIFQFSDSRSQARCAIVCKVWSDTVIPYIWATVKDVENLLKLFPVIESDSSVEEESFFPIDCDVLGNHSWERFNKYARYVKVLVLVHWNNATFHHVLEELAYTHSSGSLLPNLIELSISANGYGILHSAMFLHEGLQCFRATSINTTDEIRKIIDYVVHKAPNVIVLELHPIGSIDCDHFYDKILFASKQLQSLDSLIMRSFSLSDVVSALASFTRLKHLLYSSERTVTVDAFVGQETLSLPWLDPVVSCVSLQSITLQVTMPEFSRVLSLDCLSGNMKKVMVTITNPTDWEHHLHTSFVQLVQKFGVLECLEFSIPIHRRESSNWEHCELGITIIHPLLDLNNLTTLIIHHYYAISITDEDAEMMARRCTQMIHLKLNPEPQLPIRPVLTLSALKSFTEHCKNLKSLGLFIDAAATDNLPNVNFRSKTLVDLNFGFSPIGNPERVVSYIHECCPNCHLSEPKLSMDESRQEYIERKNKWNEVAKSLLLLSSSEVTK